MNTDAADYKIATVIRIPRLLHGELKIAAAMEGRDLGDLVEDALKAYLLNAYFKMGR